jgi:hypothetical protein
VVPGTSSLGPEEIPSSVLPDRYRPFAIRDWGTLTLAFNNPDGEFRSLFDEFVEETLDGLNGHSLSDRGAVSPSRVERTTIHVDVWSDPPPQLGELNAFVREGRHRRP